MTGDSDGFPAWAVLLTEVIAIYARPLPEVTPMELQERAVKASEKVAKSLSGDDESWKGDDE